MARSFGVTSTATGVAASLLQTVETTSTVEMAEARNNVGKVSDQKAYSKTDEVRVDFLVDDASTVPAAGTSATAGGLTGLVSNVSKSETGTNYATGSYTLQKKDAATQVAYS